MSVRLTGYMRERILNKLLAHKFNSEFAIQNEREKALGDKIYRDIFSESDIELMNSLPEGWLSEDHSIGIQFSDKYYHNVTLPKAHRFPDNKRNGCLRTYEARHPFSIEWTDIVNVRTDIKSRQAQARAAATAILESVTMTGALAAKWPEVVPFLPEEPTLSNLPAPSFDAVNKMLGLPVAEAQQEVA